MFKYYPQLLENELDYLGRDFSEDSSRGSYGATEPQLAKAAVSKAVRRCRSYQIIDANSNTCDHR